MEWIIIVSQMVVGKSKFPHAKVGKFARFKPEKYSRGSVKPHKIVYHRSFIGTEEAALEKAEQVDKEMFNTYIFGMGDLKLACVSEYTVTLHNITKDESKQMSSTVQDHESTDDSFLFEGVKCSNALLGGRWSIVKGLR
jgi:hypothetical protein